MFKLYDYFRSSACFRVRIALNLKKLDYDIVPIHLLKDGGEQFKEDYQKINPQQLVPALAHGDKIITQSLAIIEYLDEEYPTPPLLPKNSIDKSLVRSLALTIAADIHPLNNTRVLKYLTEELSVSDEKKNQWYHHWIKKGLSALEQRLKVLDQSGDFCFGDTPSLADVCLIPQLFNAKRFACDLTNYELLNKIDQNCLKHDAFIQAMPKE